MCKIPNNFLMVACSLLGQWVNRDSSKNSVALFLVVSPLHFKVCHFRLAGCLSQLSILVKQVEAWRARLICIWSKWQEGGKERRINSSQTIADSEWKINVSRETGEKEARATVQVCYRYNSISVGDNQRIVPRSDYQSLSKEYCSSTLQ